MMMPTEFSSRLKARPMVPLGNSHHLAGHDAGEAVDAGNAVAHLQHAAYFAHVDLRLVVLNFLLDDRSDLVGFEFHECSC